MKSYLALFIVVNLFGFRAYAEGNVTVCTEASWAGLTTFTFKGNYSSLEEVLAESSSMGRQELKVLDVRIGPTWNDFTVIVDHPLYKKFYVPAYGIWVQLFTKTTPKI